jgi:hypothetical protein
LNLKEILSSKKFVKLKSLKLAKKKLKKIKKINKEALKRKYWSFEE